MDRLDKHFEMTETSIRSKPNYQKIWHRLIAWITGIFLRAVGRDFNQFWTTLGNVIYAPSGRKIDHEHVHTYATLCHELAHRYDDRTHGWYYRLTYLFSSSARARWEYRGYAMAEVARYRKTGRTSSDHSIQMYAQYVSGGTYGWAFDKEEFFDTIRTVASKIEQQSIDVFDPNEDVFEQLHPHLKVP